jgi:hypothetical protein
MKLNRQDLQDLQDGRKEKEWSLAQKFHQFKVAGNPERCSSIL